jgi:hypothetical protein
VVQSWQAAAATGTDLPIAIPGGKHQHREQQQHQQRKRRLEEVEKFAGYWSRERSKVKKLLKHVLKFVINFILNIIVWFFF